MLSINITYRCWMLLVVLLMVMDDDDSCGDYDENKLPFSDWEMTLINIKMLHVKLRVLSFPTKRLCLLSFLCCYSG